MIDWFSPLLTLSGYAQSYQQHKTELYNNTQLTELQLEESSRFHNEQLNVSQELHTEQITNSRELHDIQYTHNLELASRESLRDLWAQHNHKNQTSIITLTLLYSCSFVLIVEGELPHNVSEIIIIFYSIIISLQLLCLSISLLLLLKVQSRMTHFNIYDRNHIYDCGQQHATFESYYHHHCRKFKLYAMKLCNLGLLLIYISGIILWGSKLYIQYKSFNSMIIFIILNTIGIFIIFGVLMYH